MDRTEAIEELKDILNKVMQVDDFILTTSSRLNIVLINLKIKEAHIKQNTGIDPICNEIRKIIFEIESKIDNLVKENRGKLKGIFEVLDKI